MIRKLKTFALVAALSIIGICNINAVTNEVSTVSTNKPSIIMDNQSPFALSKLVITYENEFRAKDRSPASPFFYDHNDIQLKYLLVDKYFDVFTDYRLILQDKGSGWKDQSMFLEGFNIKYPEGKWGKLNLRTRLEIGLNPAPSPTSWQLNVFPKYDFPLKLTRFKIQPFVADESFWDAEHSFVAIKNRVYAGVDWQFTQKIKGGTWYYYETQATSISVANVGVMQIRFEF